MEAMLGCISINYELMEASKLNKRHIGAPTVRSNVAQEVNGLFPNEDAIIRVIDPILLEQTMNGRSSAPATRP
jgi:hypothetical protein